MSRRSQIIDALGIGPQWVLRQTELPLEAPGVGEGAAPASPPEQVASQHARRANPPEPAQSTGPGIDRFAQQHPAEAPSLEVARPGIGVEGDPGNYSDSQIAAMDWDALQAAVSTCTRCDLCRSRTRTVFGVGDPKATWLFVGEGPGRNEDQQGEPFVGPAGKLLDNMLAAMSLRRGRNAFIANVVKCRPTDASGKDRAPNAEEAAACRPYLLRQIELIGPRTIVALGKVAGISLTGSEPTVAVSKLRGVVHRFGALPLIVTYHPAYLLRTLVDKRKSWEDLCLAMDAHDSIA